MSTPQSSPSVTFLQTLGCDDPQSILHLFRTNNAPTDPEQAVIRSIIQSGHTVSQTIHTGKQGQRLNQFIDSAQAILHPIRRLPRELITEIILHALHKSNGTLVAAVLDTNQGPWPYSQICSLWRDVVVSCPKLWSVWELAAFGFTPPYLKEDNDRHALWMVDTANRMRTIVDRSPDESIHVILSMVGDEDVETPIMNMILNESKRWKQVRIHCESPKFLDELNNRLDGALDRLESLALVVDVDGEDVDDSFTGFAVAPRLTNVTLALTSTHPPVSVSLPWSQLTHYREPYAYESDIDIREQVDRLRRLLNVVCCELPPVYGSYVGSHVLLSNMRMLISKDLSILKILTLPALEILDLGVKSYYIYLMGDFLRRSHCALRELRLGNPMESSLVDMLKLVPTLQFLVLRWSPFEADLIAALTINDDADEPPLVPMLLQLSIHAHIAFDSPDGPDSSEDAFIKMVESRRRDAAGTDDSERQACLRFVCCDFEFGDDARKFSEGFKKRAQQLRDGGLEIVLKNSPRPY